MPQLKQVVEHYKDKDVVVFGMNTDEEKEDAKHVIDKMSLNYQTLLAKEVPASKYASNAAPTMVIIDRHGIVRKFHIGYSPDLYDNMVADIDKLLAEK